MKSLLKEITLTRTRYEPDRTLGSLVVSDGPIQVFRCATLCLPWADNKAQHSCSPAGRYPWVIYDSPSRHRKVILLKDIPGRSMIEVHNGNWPKDSLGCEIVGMTHADIDGDGKMDVKSSVTALDRLIQSLGDQTSGWLTIVGDGTDTLRPGMNGYPLS